MTGSRPEKRTKEEGEDRDRRSGKRIARGDSGAVETSPTGASQYATDNRTTSMVGPRHSINQEGSNFGGEYTLAPGASLQQGNITNIHETADKCLRDLRVTDPRHDKRRIQDTKGGLLKDSYVWVLDNPDFRLWCDDQHQRLLWIKGDPGKGKTMLLCGIIDELEATRAQGELASYFFCQATDERLNNATAVLRGLLYMLLEQEPSLVSHIKKKYDRDGKALFYDANAWHAMSEIFTNMLHDPKLQGVCLLVDALDECSTGLNQLLDLVTTTSQSTSAKWLVSSRNWWQIEERLRTVAQRLSLEVNATSVSTAVDSYITFKVAHLSQLKGYQDKTASKVRQYLSSNADGTFLWVALVCQELKKTPRWMALQIVESFPAGLDAFYERMMQQICEEKYTTELCSQVLALLATTYRPLSLAECTTFIEECRDLAEDRESLQDIIGLCGSFLTLREDTVYFVHQSAKDFLLNKQYNSIHQILPLGIKHQHHVILSKSLDALSSTLRRNIYELRSPGVCIENVSPPNPDPLAPLKYSCTHWVDHLEHSNPTESPACNDVQDNARVHRFLKRHFLHWVEAQSLLQGMAQAVAAIQKLLTLVAHAEGAPQLKELAQDTLRFVLSYKQCVESFPLQIYVAALLFSPTLSVVRQVFRAEAPAWITVVTEIEANWNACLQTLEGHGGLLYSLWDTATGQCERTLKGHSSWVCSVAFAPDGRLLASASLDNTVKLWDTATGQCERTLEGHSDWVRSLASGSYDNTVKLWDTAMGQCERTLKGHGGPVSSVAFAPDGRLLASASYNSTLWDTATGQCERTLEGHISLENVFEATIQKSSQEPNRQHHVLSQHGAWIKSGSQNILWLPPEYRAGCCAVDGSTIALGCGLGRVLIVQFGLEGS
ncbi:hypothetical protein LX36DRAFT_663931 [Colletotrichum falcatum]|nr:hypothetical protein LX36DRAFT_663931 [Colletotrichum falcatum]